ncbi:TIGR03643 family protein [Acinetobacter junii]|uniref:TIGR03643 family protein n=1 Tax=Acinetobacter junii TaxID=40215 RepID=UPI0022EA958E|nr:TIGR03643 family protein [Acinetobacter junii]MDA3507861.1 TIGR03643 family protein [Acinetobacter junii]MDA3533921.1 TIGR03643 family protein [Acinetobacter junii]
MLNTKNYDDGDLSRIIEMAWEDRTPFEALEREYGLNESAVIKLMRQNLQASSFKLWRKRVMGRKTKHLQLRSPEINRGYCSRQYKHH